MRPPLAILYLLFHFTAPVSAQTSRAPDISKVRSAIDAGNQAYIAAFRQADAKALAQVYDPKGARLNEGGAMARGRSAIIEDVGNFVHRVGPVRVTLETKEVWLMDENAYETGLWSYTFQPAGKAEQHIGGHYVTVWRRRPDGGWKIWADMGVPGT